MTRDQAIAGLVDALGAAWQRGYGGEHRKARGILADPEHFLFALIECADLSGDQVMAVLEELGRLPKRRRWRDRFVRSDTGPRAEVIPLFRTRGADDDLEKLVRKVLANELWHLSDNLRRSMRPRPKSTS